MSMQKRELLVVLAAGRGLQAMQYWGGGQITTDQIGRMADEEVEKLYAYACCEARLEAVMAKALGMTVLYYNAMNASGVRDCLLSVSQSCRTESFWYAALGASWTVTPGELHENDLWVWVPV